MTRPLPDPSHHEARLIGAVDLSRERVDRRHAHRH